MDMAEIIVELIMEVAILYVAYMFWESYRRTGERSMLVMTWTFAIIFVAHTAFALIAEDIFGYTVLKAPFEIHHLLFLGLLFVIIYIQRQRSWRSQLRQPETEDKKAA